VAAGAKGIAPELSCLTRRLDAQVACLGMVADCNDRAALDACQDVGEVCSVPIYNQHRDELQACYDDSLARAEP
jgi:hypothetical protein